MTARALVKFATLAVAVFCALSIPVSPWSAVALIVLMFAMWLLGCMYGIESAVDRAAEDLRKAIKSK